MTRPHAGRRGRVALAALAATTLVVGLAVTTAAPAGAVNPALARNSHGRFDSGKPLPHVSGGTEVAFAEERAEAADSTGATGADLPPDATASALGCANRGTLTNPRVNQDCTARRQAEEQIAVNPSDPNNLIAGQNDSRIGFNHCGYDYSLDGGKTWGDGIPPYSQHLSPIGHVYDAASDPNVTFAGGTAWYSCVVFDVNSNASGLFANPSTAGLKGSAYANIAAGASRYVVAETADGHTFYDKQFLSGAPDGSVYVTFTRFFSDQKCGTGNNPGALCSSEIFMSKWNPTAIFGTETVGHGAWSTPVSISGNSPLCVGGNTFDKKAAADACNFNQGSMPVALSGGGAFVVWNNGNTTTLVNQTLGRRIMPNGTLGAVVKVGKDDESNVALCDVGRGPEQCVTSLDVRTNDFPALSVDPSNSAHLVAVWQDSRASAPGAGQYTVVVSQSTDGGVTWSDGSGAGTVLAPAPGGALFEPSVAITGSGRVVVSSYRANPYTGNVRGGGSYGYGIFSRAATDAAFTDYVAVSDGQTYPSPETSPTQTGFLGDYSSVAAPLTGDSAYAIWSDTRNGSAAAGPDEDVFVKKLTF